MIGTYELACKIDNFYEEFLTYEYYEEVEKNNREENILRIEKLIDTSQINHIVEELENFIKETAFSDGESIKAYGMAIDILNEIEKYK